MLPNDIRHLCFDKDGVLTNVHGYWAHNSRLRVRRIIERFQLSPEEADPLLDAMGIAAGENKIKPGGPVGYEPRPVILRATASFLAGRGKTVSPDEIGALFKEIDARQQRNGDYRVEILPGVREFLQGVDGRALKLSIYSSDRSENTRTILERLGLADRFEIVIGGGDVERPKPHPEGFQKACGAIGVPPEASAYAGDTLSDMDMAQAGGAKLRIGVTTGLHDEKTLAKKAHRVVARLDELL